MAYKIAVVGATGNVGREMLSVLVERQFPISEVVALASTRSVGTEVSFGDGILKVKALDYYDFKGTDICLMSAGGAIAKEWAPKIAAQGAMVIDNSSAWRMDRAGAAGGAGGQCRCAERHQERHHRQSQLLDRPAGGGAEAAARSVPPSSGWWFPPINRSPAPARRRWTNCSARPAPCSWPIRSRSEKFTKQIAFNVIPHIDVFLDSGFTKEEWKMMVETQKILDPDIQVTATCVRVPVFVGHSESVNIEFEKPITAEKARAAAARGAGRAGGR